MTRLPYCLCISQLFRTRFREILWGRGNRLHAEARRGISKQRHKMLTSGTNHADHEEYYICMRNSLAHCVSDALRTPNTSNREIFCNDN